MADFEWQDPLLITDASSSQQQIRNQTHRDLETSCSLNSLIMENPNEFCPTKIDGRSVLGYSLTSPDLVLCMGSPDYTNQRYEDSPEFLKGGRIDVSLENGIDGSESESFKTPASRDGDLCPEASFELHSTQLVEENLTNNSVSEMRINVGSTCDTVFHNGIRFSEDSNFIGGDTVNGDCEGLYKTGRFGNFSYHIRNLEPGSYIVDLHFAEIVFTNGPAGMRIFDVFLQEQKVVSSLDIYERVGANSPLVISDLSAYVTRDGGISIKFEGVNESPIVCGVSIRKDSSNSSGKVESDGSGLTYMQQCESLNEVGCYSNDGDFLQLQNKLLESKQLLDELKKENDLKDRECKEAWKSLKDLQNELMRKSMHVGSLAFAIEGQVKEKSKWFSSLRDLTRKLKILKMDHVKLTEEASVLKQCLIDAEGVNSTVMSTMNRQLQLHEEIKAKFLHEVKERKELYNKVLELKGNIRVFCRCRPMNNEEIHGGASKAVEFDAAKDGELFVKQNGVSRKIFRFDAIFSPEADQAEVFEETAPLASSVLDGYNVCIFAYGQTGTGKTFTMEGTNEARGVNYRTLEKLFQIIEERKNTFRYDVSVSVLEVYNEQIRDLLVSGSQAVTNSKRLEIKQVGEGGHHVPGLTEANVTNVSEVWEVLRTGSNGRAVGSTNANEHSSRSHCMHCVMVKGESLLNGECTRSKLWLVDLAGSERIAKSEVQGERLKETQNINRSLSALGDVISALAIKSSHIPFRNSKLTHLLQDSLGGDSKALMFVQISPNENDVAETLCSLNFASRVRGIELGPAKKQMDNSELLKYKQMAEKLKQDLKSRDCQVRKVEDTNYGLEVKIKERDLKNKTLQDKISPLESITSTSSVSPNSVDEHRHYLTLDTMKLKNMQIKELESQLVIERKLGRQETKQEEQKCEQRAPLTIKTLTEHIANTSTENNNKFLFRPTVSSRSSNDSFEKENNPQMSEQFQLPHQIGRASLCPNFKRNIPNVAPRRNSLIPYPSMAKLHTTFLPLAPIQAEDEEITGLPPQIGIESPKERKFEGKKLSIALRKSFQKKGLLKSPMQARRGVNVGVEKVRVSIGGRGRNGQRMFLGNGKRVVGNNTQVKQNHKEKERGWNIGTGGRALL